ncbi:MAG: phosphoribosylaminoimidazolesuccinocarboxamide synthase [Bacteroidales bacterium]|nr:phosphoribosylaminoimidazolesuccinocarboxamide synthase [Bacteroidales bacterium]
MRNAVVETNFTFPGQSTIYKGKVRDVYTLDNQYLLMITTDRISAFDVVLPRGIPYKGQVLNMIASKFLDATEDILPNWKIATPDPMVTFGRLCEPFKVEMVIRGYLSGHAWREYRQGKRSLCGVPMPDGMKENQRLITPIITPTTKTIIGHDEDVSRDEIISSGLVGREDYHKLEEFTYALFERGTRIAENMGLILVDTKYEFGKIGDQIYLIDEIHTPDSSRYFYAEGYEERLENDEPQRQLSKEFVREWLMLNGFQGKEDQQVPVMDDDFVHQVSERYIELYEIITGEKFLRSDVSDVVRRVEDNTRKFLQAYRR